MNSKRLLTAFAFFLAGAVFGWVLSGNLGSDPMQSTGGNVEQMVPSLPEAGAAPDGVDRRNPPPVDTGILTEKALPVEARQASVASTLERLSGLHISGQEGPLVVVPSELVSRLSSAGQVRTLNQKFFPEGSDWATYLQVDDVDRERLETEWGNLRERVRKAEIASAQFEEKADGSLVITLPDLKHQMEAQGEIFRASVAATLGPNRAEVLLAAAQVDRVVDALGAGRKLTVRAEETGDGGWRYHTVVEGPDGKRTYVGENIPPALQHLAGELQMAPVEE